MLGNFKNMAGLAGMLKDMPRVKAKMEDVKDRLANLTVTAETGGGAVRATSTGDLKITSVQIDPAILRGLVSADATADHALAEDLIRGAVNAALEKARSMAEREMMEAMSDLGVPLPPEALGGMLT